MVDTAKPLEAKPREDKPLEAKPREAKPLEAKPREAKPLEAKSREAKEFSYSFFQFYFHFMSLLTYIPTNYCLSFRFFLLKLSSKLGAWGSVVVKALRY